MAQMKNDATPKTVPAQALRKRGRRSANAPATPPPPRNQAFDAATVALGARIKDARRKRGMTQSDLAQGDFSKSYVSAVERGKIRPSIQALQLLASRLGLQVAALLAQSEGENAAESEQQATGSLQVAQGHLYYHEPAAALAILQEIPADELPHAQLFTYHYVYGRAAHARNASEEAIVHLDQAMEVAKEAGDVEGMERVRSAAARAYTAMQSKAPNALERLRQGLEAIDQGMVRDTGVQLDILQGLANEYLRQQSYDDVLKLEDYFENLRLRVFDWRTLAEHYWQLAEDTRTDDATRSMRYAEKALVLAEFLEHSTLAARLQSAIALAIAQTGKIEQAMHMMFEAVVTALRSGDATTIAHIHAVQAQLAVERQMYSEARNAAEKALQHSGQSTDRRSRAQALLVLANVEEAEKNNDVADRHFEDAIHELEQLNDSETLSSAYHRYGRSLIARGNAERGAQYLEQAYLSLTRS